jgi:sRNA-binding protein
MKLKPSDKIIFNKHWDWLYKTFPQCFDRLNPKPLKRRIEKDIYPHLPEDQSISRLTLRRAIAFYTRWIKYRRALAQTTHRYDLEGNPVEEIQGAHKERAEVQLKEQAKRRAQMRPTNKRGGKPFGRNKRPYPGPKSETPTGSSSSGA